MNNEKIKQIIKGKDQVVWRTEPTYLKVQDLHLNLGVTTIQKRHDTRISQEKHWYMEL